MFKNNIATNNGYYLTGSSNLTDAGLGLKPTSNVELTIGDSVNKANSDYKEVCHWFEDIWKKAKEKIRKYNGAILADAVGLGKTFSALAVIKFFQIQGYTTVLLCPKKLQQNWTQYLKGAGSRFDKDRFDYQIHCHTVSFSILIMQHCSLSTLL